MQRLVFSICHFSLGLLVAVLMAGSVRAERVEPKQSPAPGRYAVQDDLSGPSFAVLDGLNSRPVRGRKQNGKFSFSTGEWRLSLTRLWGTGELLLNIYDSDGLRVAALNLNPPAGRTQAISLATLTPRALSQALIEIVPAGEQRFHAELQLFSADPLKRTSYPIAVEQFRSGNGSTQGTYLSNDGSATTLLAANVSNQVSQTTVSIVSPDGSTLASQVFRLPPRAQLQLSPALGTAPFAVATVRSDNGAALVMSAPSRFLRQKALVAAVQRLAELPTTGFANSSFDLGSGVTNVLRLSNLAASPAAVRLSAFDLNGRTLGAALVELPPLRSRQLNLLDLPDLGVREGARGTISVESFGSGKILGEIERLAVVRTKSGGQVSFADAAALTDSNEVTVPSQTPGLCQAGAGFDIAACLNDLIERKDVSVQRLRVNIGPGLYVLKRSVLIFDREKIEIHGTLDSRRRRLTKIVLDNGLEQTKKTNLLQYFTINIVDSNDVTIADLALDGNFNGGSLDPNLSGSTADLLTAQRGITVCPSASHLLHGIALNNLGLAGFSNYNVLIGNVFGDTNIPTWINQSPNIALSPGETRLLHYVRSTPQGMFCGGSVSDVSFTNSQVLMRNVGFYAAPYTQLQTKSVVLTDPNYQSESPTSLRSIQAGLSALQREYVISGNTFTVDSTMPAAAEAVLHSAIKVHHSQGMRIENNQFDGGSLRRTFAGGSVINLAAGMTDALVSGNTILLPPGHRYFFHGIAVEASHQTHALYGVGAQAVFGGSERLRIENNILNGSKIYVFDCCLDSTAAYCRDADLAAVNHALPNEVVMSGNSDVAGARVPQSNLLYILSRDDRAFVPNHPTVVCRQSLNFSLAR